MVQPNVQSSDRSGGFLSLAARLFWMALGNVVLLMSSISIIGHKGQGLHTADVVFWITVPALVVVRYLDIKLWDGQTAMGTRATMVHWRKYAALLLVCSTAVWVVCHVVNYLREGS
jgi:hypothetical protein